MRDATTYRATRRAAWRKTGGQWPAFNSAGAYQVGSLPPDFSRADINYLKKIFRGRTYRTKH